MSGLSFRFKLVLSFALAALVPLTAILVISTYLVRSRFNERLTMEVTRAGRVLQETLAHNGQEIATRVAGLAGEFDLREAVYLYAEPSSRRRAQKDLGELLQRACTDRGLDLLQLTSPDAFIVASGHDPARPGQPDTRTLVLAERYPATPVLTMEEGVRVRGLALEVSVPVEEGRVRLMLTGGRFVNQRFLAQLPVDDTDALLLLMPDGTVQASTTSGGAQVLSVLGGAADATSAGLKGRLEQANMLVEEVALQGVTTADPVQVFLATSREPLDEMLGWLTLSFAVLAAAGVGLAWSMGLLLAQPVTRPVDQLVKALEKVAAGDLSTRVEIQRSDELGQVARAFNEMTRDLDENRTRLLASERVAAWRDIARRLAHEIKNPLSPIQLSMETLQKCYRQQHQDFGGILEESTTTVLEEVERLRRIVQEFSDFARLPKPSMTETDLNEVVHGVLALHTGLDPRFELITELHSGGCRLSADPDQMSRALLNLLKNSIEAMPDGGRVTIGTRCLGDTVELSVADDGPGVDAEARSRLFQPYWTTKTSGTGLGLAIVHRIVSEHGGHIDLDRSVERGTRFMLTLPVVRPEPEPNASSIE